MSETVKQPEAAEPQKRGIAIIGCADSKLFAPFNDPTWEVWGVNNLFYQLPRWDKWFEIHLITQTPSGQYLRRYEPIFRGVPVDKYLADIGKMGCPVYMQKKWEIVPNSVEFPFQAILNRFPRRYITNTISWQLALAIMMIEQGQALPKLGIWGVDMAVASEYNHQRPSCEYFIGIAEGMGIQVTIPDEADLLKTRFLYAMQEKEQTQWDKKVNMMMHTIRERLNAEENQMNLSKKKVEQYIGALEAAKEMKKIWG